MIEFSHVYKTYPGPVHALKNVDITIDKGEFVFLTGPSGAGKTTLFKLLSGFDKATSGKVQVGEYDLTAITENQIPFYRRRIGVIYQDFKLLKNKTVFENLALPLQIKNDSAATIRRKIYESLELVGLSEKASQLPEFLSGGEQQRTAIARAIIHQPGVLIADEPTGNLDPALTEDIMNLLDRVCAQGTTVFVATHDHELVKRRKKRTLKLQEGLLSE